MTPGRLFRMILSAIVLVAGCAAVYLVSTGQSLPFVQGGATEQELIATPHVESPKSLGDYSWHDLSVISEKISAAASDDEGRAIAQQYGLVDESGHLTDQEKAIEFADGSVISVQLVGIRHDEKEDGSGKAGLTFMTNQAIATHAINDGSTIEGGWEGSGVRAWLNSDELTQLPESLQDVVVAVRKLSNNKGFSNGDASVVTQTSDKLWLFSAREVCGELSWFDHEYGSEYGYLDAVVNAEGEQYERFSDAGITGTSDPSGTLARAFQGKRCAWWYRTAFSYWGGVALDEWHYFYNVMDTGYPYAYTNASEPLGIVVGFCV